MRRIWLTLQFGVRGDDAEITSPLSFMFSLSLCSDAYTPVQLATLQLALITSMISLLGHPVMNVVFKTQVITWLLTIP